MKVSTELIPAASLNLNEVTIDVRGLHIERLYATNLFVPAQWKGDSLSETLRERFPDAIDRGSAQVQVTIPSDFASEVQAGRTGNLQVVIDGSDMINGRVTRLAIQGTTLSVVSRLQTQAQQAHNILVAAQANQQLIQSRLNNLTVKSPIDGVVTTRSVEPGTVVLPSRPLLRVVDLSQVYLRGFIPGGQIAQVRVGQLAMKEIKMFYKVLVTDKKNQ